MRHTQKVHIFHVADKVDDTDNRIALLYTVRTRDDGNKRRFTFIFRKAKMRENCQTISCILKVVKRIMDYRYYLHDFFTT